MHRGPRLMNLICNTNVIFDMPKKASENTKCEDNLYHEMLLSA